MLIETHANEKAFELSVTDFFSRHVLGIRRRPVPSPGPIIMSASRQRRWSDEKTCWRVHVLQYHFPRERECAGRDSFQEIEIVIYPSRARSDPRLLTDNALIKAAKRRNRCEMTHRRCVFCAFLHSAYTHRPTTFFVFCLCIPPSVHSALSVRFYCGNNLHSFAFDVVLPDIVNVK